MGTRQGKKMFGKKTVMFIIIILSVGLIGVGYAKWSGGMNIGARVKTGNIKSSFFLKDDILHFSNGSFNFSLSGDKDILYVEGEVYPDFDRSIPIEIMDEGSVPSVFIGLSGEGGEITDLMADTVDYGNGRLMGFGKKDFVQPFKLNIRAYEGNAYEGEYRSYSVYNEDMSGLERQIEDLRDAIRQYDRVEHYNFEYKLDFEQDI